MGLVAFDFATQRTCSRTSSVSFTIIDLVARHPTIMLEKTSMMKRGFLKTHINKRPKNFVIIPTRKELSERWKKEL